MYVYVHVYHEFAHTWYVYMQFNVFFVLIEISPLEIKAKHVMLVSLCQKHKFHIQMMGNVPYVGVLYNVHELK